MASSVFVLPRPIVFVLLVLGCLFAIDLFALAAQREAQLAADNFLRQADALAQVQALPTMVVEMQSGMRGFLLTGSAASLERYRNAANGFPGAAARAVTSLDDAGLRRTVEASGATVRDWIEQHASPLVIRRGAADSPAAIAALSANTRKAEPPVDHIMAQLREAIRIQREHVADAGTAQKRSLDTVSSWMRGRALALLIALASLTMVLGRTLARLTGQTRSREVAEVAMRTSSATLRAMSDASPVGMFLADRSGACVQSNPSFERIAGLPESAVLGHGWQANLHPDDRARVVAAWDATTGAHAPFSSVHRFVHRNGKVVWASMKSAKISDAGEVIGFACSIEDVSERREAEEALRKSEERLHLALESSRLALFDWHLPSGEIFLSREWSALTGYGQDSVTTSARRLNDLIHPADRESLREAIISAFKTNKPLSRAEFRIETRSGQWKKIHCSGRVTERDAVGRAVRFTGTTTTAD